MKSILLLIVAGLILCTLKGQKLSSNAKTEFCRRVQMHFFSSSRNDDFYKAIIYEKINTEYYQRPLAYKNSIVVDMCSNDEYFKLITDATYNASSPQMLFTHLYSFLGMSRINAIAVKNYILAVKFKEIETKAKKNTAQSEGSRRLEFCKESRAFSVVIRGDSISLDYFNLNHLDRTGTYVGSIEGYNVYIESTGESGKTLTRLKHKKLMFKFDDDGNLNWIEDEINQKEVFKKCDLKEGN